MRQGYIQHIAIEELLSKVNRPGFSIAVGVTIDNRLEHRLEDHLDHRLCHPISNCWRVQNPCAPALLRDRHGFDWRRKIAARGHPISKLVQVVLELALKLLNRFIIHSSTSAIRLDLLECLPDKLLGNDERLGHLHMLLPLAQLA